MNSVKVLLEVMSLPEQAQAINNIIIHHNAGVAIQDQDIKVLGGRETIHLYVELCAIVQTSKREIHVNFRVPT